MDRAVLAARFGWDPSRPVVGVYAPNWFDYPNGSGRFPFRDFRDWAEKTIAAASDNKAANWLFKSHPCDEWYGKIRGVRLADLVAAADAPHVQLCDTAWNGKALFSVLDGLITVHGTAGLEAAALEMPVLVPYAGWYGAFGFVTVADSAEDYLSRLSTPWWQSGGDKAAASRAHAFAGWYFAAPAWHDGWFLSDDANQDAIWWDLNDQLEKNADAIAHEVAEIRDWIEDGHPYFQIFKLRRATSFMPAHPYAPAGAPSDEDPRRRQLTTRRSA